MLRALMTECPVFDAAWARNERGETGGKAALPNLRSLGPAFRVFDDLIRSRVFLSWLGEATSLSRLLYDPEYVGGGVHLNLPDQELDPHVDFNYHPRTGLHRRLNLILFLNPEWREEWGGMLELTDNPLAPDGRSAAQPVLPEANRCVVFETSERSWHGFPRIAASAPTRRSIAVYFYTRTRHAAETAPSHGTIYYQRPLPPEIAPGRTLTEEDVAMIQSLIARRDRQMEFLYERELAFSRMAESPTFRLARWLTWPLRALLQR